MACTIRGVPVRNEKEEKETQAFRTSGRRIIRPSWTEDDGNAANEREKNWECKINLKEGAKSGKQASFDMYLREYVYKKRIKNR